MPYIEDVEKTREKVAALNAEIIGNIGDEIDAENAQERNDCLSIEDELHPDFEVQHPDFFYEGDVPSKTRVSSYRKIELWDKTEI